MSVPVKIHGAFRRGLRPIDFKILVALSYHMRGERWMPYRDRLSSQYDFGGVNGQPKGGRRIYLHFRVMWLVQMPV